METSKKISSFLILFTPAFLFVFAGCQAQQKQGKADLNPDSDRRQTDTAQKRFQGADSGSQTAVDAAIKLAQEYAELSDKMAQLQKKNQELAIENARLKDHIAVLEPELQQTKKELDEANNLLIQMRIELNNWKTDILGFRDEIRQADKAQLQTLLKILEVLGGEIKLSPEQTQDVNNAQKSN
jgi:chromosome segregation ATPase